jgi:NADH dehydrogenase
VSRVLVTGGTGFVGPHVVRALVEDGHDVRVLARRPERVDAVPGSELVQGDMTDAASLRRAADGRETIVHLVALAPFADPRVTRRVMEEGGRDLVAAAKEAGVGRFVLMSALGTSERSREVAPYYHAKWAMEQEVLRSGLEATIFRPSFIFGADGGILPGLVQLVRWSPVTPVVGTKRMQPIWVDDVAAFFAKAVAGGPGGTYDLGGPEVVSWDELHERLRRALGKRRVAVHIPMTLVRAGARAGSLLPPLRGAPYGVAMLEFEDNTGDIGPAVETFGVDPIGLDEQLRRGTG